MISSCVFLECMVFSKKQDFVDYRFINFDSQFVEKSLAHPAP